jgi:hypothetical protein
MTSRPSRSDGRSGPPSRSDGRSGRQPRPARPSAHRVADMQLRGRVAPLATRLYWPAPYADTRVGMDVAWPPALLVVLPSVGAAGDAERVDVLSHGLCASAGVVVLTLLRLPNGHGDDAVVDTGALRDAGTALGWAADHAAELGADPGRLVIAGWATGAVLAAAVARHASEQGWPEIARQVLICPDRWVGGPQGSLAGVAPATVVTIEPGGGVTVDAGPSLVTRLRRAGLRVDELRYEGLPPGEPAWTRWSDAAQLVMADLARSLQHRLGMPPTPATWLFIDDSHDREVGAP